MILSQSALDTTTGRSFSIDLTDLRRPKDLRKRFLGLANATFLGLLTLLVLCVPRGLSGQSASEVAESRLDCAQGAGQEAAARVRNYGAQMGIAEVCVKALSWIAKNGNLLDIYSRGTGPDGARALVNRLTDSARTSMAAFRPDGSPQDMWNKGELTPSLAFDAGFTRSYLDRTGAPSASVNQADLNRRTELCMNNAQSLSVCVEAGRTQGQLAYQMNNAFSDGGSGSGAQSGSGGPDEAQTAATVDQKFQQWAQGWSFDRYIPGSAHVTGISCSGQCKASGNFSFNRFGSVHTIPFAAFLSPGSNGQYSLDRLCYNDETTNMLDCTQ